MNKGWESHLREASKFKCSHIIYFDGECCKEEQLIFKQEIYKDENVKYNLLHWDFVNDDYRK